LVTLTGRAHHLFWNMRARFVVKLSLATLLVTWAHAVGASEPEATDERPALGVHIGLTVAAIATFATLEALKPKLAPAECRWCDRSASGADELNGFDRSARHALRWSATGTADTLSTTFSFVLAPAAGVIVGSMVTAHDGRTSELPANILVVVESAAFAVDIDALAKLGFARERPYAHARTPEERARLHSPTDNLSFFSGHATLAFALAVSSGTVASMRGYRWAPVMWVTGLTLASVGGYLRIAADKHYATDVLAGVAVGSSVGFAVPYFLHRTHGARLGVVPMARGFALAGSF
jgi:membrane-associated phospholipid phosphatase